MERNAGVAHRARRAQRGPNPQPSTGGGKFNSLSSTPPATGHASDADSTGGAPSATARHAPARTDTREFEGVDSRSPRGGCLAPAQADAGIDAASLGMPASSR